MSCPDNLLTLLISALLRFNRLGGQKIFVAALLGHKTETHRAKQSLVKFIL